MICSMTGFGRGHANTEDATATVEIQSTNKRHLNIFVHLPDPLPEGVSKIRQRLQAAFERGQFDVNVSAELTGAAPLPVDINPELARHHKERLEQLAAAAEIDDSVRLRHLLAFEDLFGGEEEREAATIQHAWPAVTTALDAAIDDLRAMRKQEGAALRDELEQRTHAIDAHLSAIEERAPTRVHEQQARLRARLQSLMDDESLDRDRIETEMALLADKLDVTEECVRLHSHLEMFRDALTTDTPAGRKLKFVTQEIHREANTIGAKANDETISRHAVEMKEEIEKIKEQIRNVE
jgi:uncharacterized protein (TIGR00255 family)